MTLELIIAAAALFVTVVINIVVIAFLAGKLKSQTEQHKEALEEIKKTFEQTVLKIQNDFKEKLKDLKENLSNKISDNAKHFEEHIARLENKQDKHNSMIERQYKSESDIDVLYEKMEVANHRIADLERE